MTSRAHDRKACGVAPWTSYVLSPGGMQLAVYHGRQVSESACNTTGFTQYQRRVHMYPVEYRAYGPDGINVIFERNQAGAWVKRFANLDRQGSVLAVSDAAVAVKKVPLYARDDGTLRTFIEKKGEHHP